MIQQAADCANGLGGPPPELYILQQCRTFGCLPEAGGYNQQDGPTMERAKIYDAVYNFVARNRQDNKKSIDYAELSEPDRKIYDWLRELEIKF